MLYFESLEPSFVPLQVHLTDNGGRYTTPGSVFEKLRRLAVENGEAEAGFPSGCRAVGFGRSSLSDHLP